MRERSFPLLFFPFFSPGILGLLHDVRCFVVGPDSDVFPSLIVLRRYAGDAFSRAYAGSFLPP